MKKVLVALAAKKRNVKWNSDNVTITLIGCEQSDKKYTVMFTE